MLTDLEPGSDPRLAALFAAAKAPAELPLPGEEAALTAYRTPGRSWFARRGLSRHAQLVAAAIFGGVVVAGGVATAATGTLPVISHHSHSTQARPADATDATDATGDDSTATDESQDGATGDNEVPDSGGPGSAGHPAALGSVAKGMATCSAASHGKCQAGQHGKALSAHTHQATHSLPAAATQHRSGHATGPSAAASHRHMPAHRTPHHRG
jgi:hypothetical protein